MTTKVTQCPNCNTSFRVTDAQLDIANGAVRCGSCLNIFQAASYWLDQKNNTTDEQSNNSSDELDFSNDTAIDEADELSSLDSIFEDGDIDDSYLDQLSEELLGDDELIGEAFDIDATENEPPEPPLDSTLDSIEEEPKATKEPIDIETLDIDDDAAIIDDNLLDGKTKSQSIINIDDDLEELSPSEASGDEAELSSFFLDLDQDESKSATVYKELDDIGEDDGNEDNESWAKKLLEEAERDDSIPYESDESESEQNDDDIYIDDIPEKQLDPELLDILNETEELTNEVEEEEFILTEVPFHAGERIGDIKESLLANIEPEPVEFATSSIGNIWLKRAISGGVIVAILLLAAQYLFFNFDRLSRDVNYRPMFATTCSIIGCNVPDLSDISLVRSSNLMVRSHAEKAGALAVDAIITNHADFKQPFPTMELLFKSLSGDIVAGRRFQSEEYLAGELLGSQSMPIRQPIHISLEIIDPGESAVNYQLIFHAD